MELKLNLYFLKISIQSLIISLRVYINQCSATDLRKVKEILDHFNETLM